MSTCPACEQEIDSLKAEVIRVGCERREARKALDLAIRLLSCDLPAPNPYLTGTLADGIYQLRADLERERGETQRLRIEADYLRAQWKQTAGELDGATKLLSAELPTSNPYSVGTLAHGIYLLRADLEQERGDARWLKKETEHAGEQWERERKRIAAMREAMQYARGRVAFILRDVQDVLQAALSEDAGTGYLSPEEAERLQKQVAAMRTALNDWLVTYARDWFDDCTVTDAEKRISEHSGTVGYITDVRGPHAGSDYKSPAEVQELVRPLVEALQDILGDGKQPSGAGPAWSSKVLDQTKAKTALAYAKEKGLA